MAIKGNVTAGNSPNAIALTIANATPDKLFVISLPARPNLIILFHRVLMPVWTPSLQNAPLPGARPKRWFLQQSPTPFKFPKRLEFARQRTPLFFVLKAHGNSKTASARSSSKALERATGLFCFYLI
ncbi:MAG: hypothetical protein IKC51_01160 [Myxococcaceae bacterium]|nr:hypothetical protein [Myxococcaceae bacterium]